MDEVDSVNSPAKLPENLVETGLSYISEREVDDSGQYTEATLKRNPLLTEAVQEVIKLGYLARDVNPVVKMILSNEGWASLTKQNVLDKLKTKEQIQSQNQRKADKEQRDFERRMREEHLDNEEIKAENRALRKKLMCQKCKGTVDVMFVSCGHVAGCSQCGVDYCKCPVCDKLFTETIRVLLCNK